MNFSDLVVKSVQTAPNGTIDVSWKDFERAVKKEFTSRHIKAISARFGIDLKRMVESNRPVKRRHVEYFGVGAASPIVANLKERMGYFEDPLELQCPERVHELFLKATKNSFLGTVEDPIYLSGSVRYGHEQLTPDYFHMDQARSNLFRGLTELISKDHKIPRLHPYYQRLIMALICQLETDPEKPSLDVVIPAPTEDGGVPEYYRVYRIISAGGLNAIALTPISKQSHLDPLLCFRCTKQTAGHHGTFESNIGNLEEHIGKAGYETAKAQLEELVSDRDFTRGRKFNVLCYSQGGGHATYFMRDHWRKVSRFIGFNSVGCDEEVVGAIAKEINELDEHSIPPVIYQHRNVSNPEGTEGDWVNKTGKRHLGYGIKHPNVIVEAFEWLIHNMPTPSLNVWDPRQFFIWLDLHGVRSMDMVKESELRSKHDRPWKYRYKHHVGPTQCTKLFDTYARDPRLEDLRLKVYSLAYRTILNLYKTIDFIFRWFNVEIFK